MKPEDPNNSGMKAGWVTFMFAAALAALVIFVDQGR